jgi:hypothetical protein
MKERQRHSQTKSGGNLSPPELQMLNGVFKNKKRHAIE